MAFQPPTADRRRQISSVNSYPIQGHHDFSLDSPASPTFSRHYDPAAVEPGEEEEWVVFSPSVTVEPSNFTATEVGTNDDGPGPSEFWTEETESRLSGTRCPPYQQETEYGADEDGEEIEDHMAYDDGYKSGCDDDDDSLQAFRDTQGANPVLLPTHDGRGMFPSQTLRDRDATVFMPGVESLEHSLRLLAGHSNIFDQPEDLNSRIQKWRLEHSSAFMEEIEAARKNKTRSRSRKRSARELREELEASMMLDDDERTQADAAAWGVETCTEKEHEGEVPETFWRRITRSLMRDIMGIDDTVLEVIFGESLPPSALNPPEAQAANDIIRDKWQRSLLERIARELGILLQQYTIHPTRGAFSTYTRWTSPQIEAQEKAETQLGGDETPKAMRSQSPSAPMMSIADESVIDGPDQVKFMPTLAQKRHHSSLHSKRTSRKGDDGPRNPAAAGAQSDAQSRKEYWEQELGVRVFFSYLKSRFSSSPPTQAPQPPVSPKTVRKAISAADIKHRPIYHQHPLLQQRGTRLRSGSVSSGSTPGPIANSWAMLGLGGYRNGSSCASQSSKRAVSKKGKARSAVQATTGPGSTLNKSYYWEVETSVGSTGGGSCVGMGVWGEI